MNPPTPPITDLSLVSLVQPWGREILDQSIADYIHFLRRQPTFCGTPEQQETLSKHVARGHELIKLIAAERLKITRELDHQKHDWMSLEKELTTPIEAAMQPLKSAVEQYNREVLRLREHQQADLDRQQVEVGAAEPGVTHWLGSSVGVLPLPKGVQLKWSFEITDPNQVPNGYWIIDEVAIKTAVAGGAREIPGVRIYEEAITTFRK